MTPWTRVIGRDVNPPSIRQPNASLVLDAIRGRAPISRVRLAELLQLAPTTITRIVSELMNIGLVKEVGEDPSGKVGRKATLLDINPAAFYSIGVDLARTNVTAILTDLNAIIEHKLILSESVTENVHVDIRHVLETIRKLIASSGVEPTKIIGIGIGAPGCINAEEGVIVSTPRFPGWRGVPLKHICEETFDVPVFIDNDANTCALAERWFGAGKGIDNFVYIAIGTGVGAGVIIDGKLYRGQDNIAGEIGHMTVNPTGPGCGCGNIGCLELYTAASALTSRVKELGLAKCERTTFDSVFRLARSGSPVAARVVEEAAYYLGIGIVNVINSFNPHAVILGREVAQAGRELLLRPIRKLVKERAFSVARSKAKVILGSIKEYPSAIGGVTLVLEELYQSPFAMTQKANLLGYGAKRRGGLLRHSDAAN